MAQVAPVAPPQPFVPPSTIRVRLIGNLSRRALYSNPRDDGVIKQFSMADVFDDQWFYIIPGTDSKFGQYRIKSAFTNEAVYLNRGKAGTSSFESAFEDQWFKFEAGTGTKVGTLRVTCPATNSALYSQNSSDASAVGSITSDKVFDDQWFSFAYEDMELDEITYDVNIAKFLEVKPVAISTKMATNNTPETQVTTITFSESVEEERSFTSELGTKLGTSATASVGIPLVGEGKVTVSAEISTTIAWGSTDRVTKSWSDSVQVTTSPGKKYKVYASARQSKFTVPFVATWKSKSAGQVMKTKGTYEGVSVYDFDTTYSEV
ncbi:hypothetical protein H072_7105 [Dactylellina haptotyla CBS 200.50]|uniref:Uncharacterized protein n=1 Tax=Dactylellina haptotyla (strain CBS 200.50) TaxID=1284197 RepID=S8BIG9_DACHA|nr:hypothetical protein H072_7105 [Dactylellina haptotyla CBS 200.50]